MLVVPMKEMTTGQMESPQSRFVELPMEMSVTFFLRGITTFFKRF